MSIRKKSFDLGAEISFKDRTSVPADVAIRPLRDVIIVEPIDGWMSAIIHVVHECKPVKGIVRAVGPGCYPRRYDHADKAKRTKVYFSSVRRPTQVQVGEHVELGGLENGGYAFQTFYWGEKLMLIAREEDVCFIVDEEMADAA